MLDCQPWTCGKERIHKVSLQAVCSRVGLLTRACWGLPSSGLAFQCRDQRANKRRFREPEKRKRWEVTSGDYCDDITALLLQWNAGAGQDRQSHTTNAQAHHRRTSDKSLIGEQQQSLTLEPPPKPMLERCALSPAVSIQDVHLQHHHCFFLPPTGMSLSSPSDPSNMHRVEDPESNHRLTVKRPSLPS